MIREFINKNLLSRSKKDSANQRQQISFIDPIDESIQNKMFNNGFAGLTNSHLNKIRGEYISHISLSYDRWDILSQDPKRMQKWMSNPSIKTMPRLVIWSENELGKSESGIDFLYITPKFVENLQGIIKDLEFYTKKELSLEEFANIPVLSKEMYEYMLGLGKVYYYITLRDKDGVIPEPYVSTLPYQLKPELTMYGFFNNEGLLNHKKGKKRRTKK